MWQQNEEQFSSKFVDKLAETCETMLVQFDAVLTIDDVEIGSEFIFTWLHFKCSIGRVEVAM